MFSQFVILQEGLDNAKEIRLGSSFQRTTENYLFRQISLDSKFHYLFCTREGSLGNHVLL